MATFICVLPISITKFIVAGNDGQKYDRFFNELF
jgi:hypothetical protein